MSSLLPSSSPFLFIKVGVIQRIQSKVMDRMCSVPQSSLTLVTPGTVAHQAPLSMGFPRQDYWSGLPFPSPGDLLNPGIKPVSPALAGKFFTTEPPEKPKEVYMSLINQQINIDLQPQESTLNGLHSLLTSDHI